MTEYLTNEQVARVILRRFAMGKIRNGEVAKTSTLWLFYSEPCCRTGEQFEGGLAYGVEKGWWEEAGNAVRLLKIGEKEIERAAAVSLGSETIAASLRVCTAVSARFSEA